MLESIEVAFTALFGVFDVLTYAHPLEAVAASPMKLQLQEHKQTDFFDLVTSIRSDRLIAKLCTSQGADSTTANAS